jgi:predicted nucleotidyltransferase
MSTYKIRYEQLRQPAISEMLSSLERGFSQFGIDFYLVGAVARDVWMSGINKIKPGRTTRDIDFAVLINDKGTFEALKDYLINTKDFHPYKGNDFVLIWKDKMQVDFLPFGAIEDEDANVITNGIGLTSSSLQGFKEIYDEGLPELELEEKHLFKFCTLPGIVILKLIAYHDRPEKRRDDIKDISDILNHFFNMYQHEIWENHNELFEQEEAELKEIAARVMGREMAKIAKRNEKLFTRLTDILNRNTVDVAESKIGAIMTEYFENTVEENVKLLLHLKQGLIE